MQPIRPTPRASLFSRAAIALLFVAYGLAFWCGAGCARQRYITERNAPRNPLEAPLRLLSYSGPRPTSRTEQVLRRYNLTADQDKRPLDTLAKLEKEIEREPSPDKIYSYAELAYIDGKSLEAQGKTKEALDLYGSSVATSYRFLFDANLDRFRNPYDPEFRRACDIYNAALEATLRIVIKHHKLKPGQVQTIETGSRKFHLDVAIKGPWHADDLQHLEFVTDYEITSALTNHHHTYGLGVPLIAVRGKHPNEEPAERFYPPGLSFPLTAFLRVHHPGPGQTDASIHHCVLELYDPLTSVNIDVGNRLVPLETDLTTPLAYFLDSPVFQKQDISTLGLFNPGGQNETKLKGLYMVEPFDPNRIPVVMVHGLWSSPTTWMEMFNDLRAFPEIRAKYQFWFFLYPTGQPFWVSASQLRETLADAQRTVDPDGHNPHLSQMVLVGHSMGGLVSKLQTLESGDDFWRILSDKPFEELKAGDDDRQQLGRLFYFHPDPHVRRVVTIGTPHRGSVFATDYLRLAGKKLITLPSIMVELTNKVIRENPGYFQKTDLITTTTSIDSLAPDDPIFPVMLAAQPGPGVKYHNIVGVIPRTGWTKKSTEIGDGVVGLKSAHLDGVDSELAVPADHLQVHRHPLAVLETRRILLEHLEEVERLTVREIEEQIMPTGYQLNVPPK